MVGKLSVVAVALAVCAARWAREQTKRRRVRPENERVLILGASTDDGLGAAFLQQYLEQGVRELVIVGRRREALEQVRTSVMERTRGKRHPDAAVYTCAADCTRPAEVAALRDYVLETLHGLDTLQIVFGVTSILPILGLANVDPCDVNADGKPSTELHASVAGLESIADTVQHSCDGNLKGTALVLGAMVRASSHQIPVLQTTSIDPVVVGTGSVAGLVPAPTRAVYCATKAAQHAFLDSVALECASQAGTHAPGSTAPRALVRFLLLAPGPLRNSFVQTYAVDATTGPRDDRTNALDVQDVVRATLSRVAAGREGMLVLPPYMFYGMILSKFEATYASLLTQPRLCCESRPPSVPLLSKVRHAVLAGSVRLRRQRALLARGRRVQAAVLRPPLGLLATLQGVEDLDHRLRRQVLVDVIVDLDHRRVRARTETLHLDHGELLVLGRVADGDAQPLLDRLEHRGGATAAKHARRRGAYLHKELAHGRSGSDGCTYRLYIV